MVKSKKNSIRTNNLRNISFDGYNTWSFTNYEFIDIDIQRQFNQHIINSDYNNVNPKVNFLWRDIPSIFHRKI